jgi:DNA-binding MarR family transcriptional regulator
MVTQPRLYDEDVVLWTQLLAEVLNAEVLEAMRAGGHPDVRYSHGFLFQQLVEGPRAVGEVAANLGVTSQAVSKAARELEALGYLERTPDPEDARVRRLALTARGRDALETGRAARAALNRRLADALGAGRTEAAAATLADAMRELGAMDAVRGRRIRPAQALPREGR